MIMHNQCLVSFSYFVIINFDCLETGLCVVQFGLLPYLLLTNRTPALWSSYFGLLLAVLLPLYIKIRLWPIHVTCGYVYDEIEQTQYSFNALILHELKLKKGKKLLSKKITILTSKNFFDLRLLYFVWLCEVFNLNWISQTLLIMYQLSEDLFGCFCGWKLHQLVIILIWKLNDNWKKYYVSHCDYYYFNVENWIKQ